MPPVSEAERAALAAPQPSDIDAGVIEEARARQRRRWTMRGGAITAIVATAGIALVVGRSGGNPSAQGGSEQPGHSSQAAGQATLTACVSQRTRGTVQTPLSTLAVFRLPAVTLPSRRSDSTRYHLARTVSDMNFYVYAAGPPQCSTSRVFLIQRQQGRKGGGGIGGPTAAQLTRYGSLGGSSSEGGPTFIFGLVPNGVASVTLYFATRRPIKMRVVNNVFVADEPRATFPPRMFGQQRTEVWRTVNGTTIKTINLATGQIVAPA